MQGLQYNTESDAPSPNAAQARGATPPEEPLVRIRADRGWADLNLAELWAHREILYYMVWRELKPRYRQSVLGPAWVILQPLLMTVVLTAFMGRLVRVASDGIPYEVFVCAGLLPWTFFSNAVASASYSLIGNAPLATKIYFSRLIFPSAAVCVRLVDFCVTSLVLAALMFAYGITATWKLMLLPVFVVQLLILALGVGISASALNAKYRDVGTLMPILLQVWMFCSPIVYPSSLVPESLRWLYGLNPLVGVLEGFRASLFGLEFDWRLAATSAAISIATLVISAYAFRRFEEDVVEVI